MKFSQSHSLISNDRVVVMSYDLATLYDGDTEFMPYWLGGYEVKSVSNHDDFSVVTLDVERGEMWTPDDSLEIVKSLENDVDRQNLLMDEWSTDFMSINSLVNIIRRKLDRDDLTNLRVLLDEIASLCQ